MDAEIKQRIESFIQNVENDKNIITLNPRIENGDYKGTFTLANDAPVFGTVKLVGTNWKKAYVKMDLVHVETGKRYGDIEVSYNSFLKTILLNSALWNQQFGARASLRTSSRTGNEYQAIEFVMEESPKQS